jgi:3-oxoacyl-(acyl-carrier-protein) synthase
VSGRTVLLTGRGVVSPLGVGLADHWQALDAGRSAVGRLDRLASLGLGASRGAEVASHALQPHLARFSRKQHNRYNRPTLLAMIGAALAMEDAGLGPGAGESSRFGVLLGVNAPAWSLDAMIEFLVASESAETSAVLDLPRANSYCMRSINPLDYSLKTLPNLIAGHIAIANGAQGCCRALAEGHVGGARAVGGAGRMIAEGELDVALCGGADDQLEELFFATHCGSGSIASDDGRPGLIPGEGSGLLVLEEAEHALARGARRHGEIAGFASGGGGHVVGDDDPVRLVERLTRVIDAALAEAGSAPDLVSLHGDGIPAHDDAEQSALARVLGVGASSTPCLRMKAAHADLGAAATPVELLACSAALAHATLPRAVSSLLPPATPAYRSALVVSLGLFGECAALMVRS